MRLNLDKCIFGVRFGQFLGYLLMERGIEANPEKISVIESIRTPTTLKALQSLVGKFAALGYFISKYLDKCHPFFEGVRKGKDFSTQLDKGVR